ncbi:hypothetical protein [Streptomyces sp. NPDC020681]|uniref:hypothetical protein n=1 Tax=Streptomyces sp. NPDC020681 TaxID=3365083 RepID=UPI00378E3419
MRRTTIVVITSACLALTGCSSSGEGATGAKAGTTPSRSEATYTIKDCKALLEENFAADTNADVSERPECQALTGDEYAQVVVDVLAGRKEDILDGAAAELVYEEAWKALDADAQALMCGLMDEKGPGAFGALLSVRVMDPSVDTEAMAEYLYAEKCED